MGRIKSYCGYEAIILKPFENKKGYSSITLDKSKYRIHRLVAQEFISREIAGKDVHH